MRRDTNPNPKPSARAFTIVEIMVTLGILILVAAGVATIFNSISETVTEGRRLAEINRFAARVELVMRRDFERMSREGFLVIVHQNAPGADPTSNNPDSREVQLNAFDTSDPDNDGTFGRPRRADEIMFFSRGDFETSRRSLSPGLVARSDQAAIYYGHGQQRLIKDRDLEEPNNTNRWFFNPNVEDPNFDSAADFQGGIHKGSLGFQPSDGTFNPNRYAADWTLLRHVTILSQPQSAGQDLPQELFGVRRLQNRDWLEDSDRQIALQPATRSIFGTSSTFGLSQELANQPMPRWFREFGAGGGPIGFDPTPVYRASGLVDIATDDLGSIREFLTGAPSTQPDTLFVSSGSYFSSPVTNGTFFTGEGFRSHDDFENRRQNVLDTTSATIVPAVVEPLMFADVSSAAFQQRQWMLDALPSIWNLDYSPGSEQPEQISRVRYQQVPPRLFYDEDFFGNPTDPVAQRARAYAQADQEVIGAAIFVPSCTEFIVEWSYGFIDRSITDPTDPGYKQPLWYGLARYAVDTNDDGVIDTSDDPVAQPYFARSLTVNPPAVTSEQVDREEYLSQLVHGHAERALTNPVDANRELSMFGYEYHNPDLVNLNPIQWPWPKFIRVTMSLADPNDPSVEETFVFTFEIPPASNN
jgi:type II secretory pathway pseudopilin PulG